jgi:cell wall assembly regulator SMI1
MRLREPARNVASSPEPTELDQRGVMGVSSFRHEAPFGLDHCTHFACDAEAMGAPVSLDMRYAEHMTPSPSDRPKGDQLSLVDSFKRLAAWLREHDAVALMQTLSAGAKPLHLSKLEQKLGFRLPPGQRTLWLLHDGQRKPNDCLVGDLHLLPVAWVVNQLPAALKVLARVRAEDDEQQAGLSLEELSSTQWLPIASNAEHCVIVNSRSGRVFESLTEPPFLKLVGTSVPQWLAGWVDELERGEHTLVRGHDGAFFMPRSDSLEETEADSES